MNGQQALLLAMSLIVLVACDRSTELMPESTDDRVIGTSNAGRSARQQTPESTASATPMPLLKDTARVTSTSIPTVTALAPTPTATVAPAPHFDVGQVPYAASECSDKYPCPDDEEAWEERIRVPPAFDVTYFTHVEGMPTSITFGPDGLLYVAVQEGAILQVEGDGTVSHYINGLDTPTGIAFRSGTDDLYVSSRVLNENVGGESQVSVVHVGEIDQIIGGIPCCYTYLHAANGIAFGPDGFGYVGVGARADHGEILEGPEAGQQDELHPWEATILRFSPDGKMVQPYAFGLRNSYDIAWDADGRLFATDNAPDFGPPDELHLITPGGQHGYPWYECDVCFTAPEGIEVIPPLYEFVPHGAAAGITAYLDDEFVGYYNNLFVVLWSAFEGAQKVIRFGPGGEIASDFATGFAAPIDLTVGPDGGLYVADWATGIIFQISYVGES